MDTVLNLSYLASVVQTLNKVIHCPVDKYPGNQLGNPVDSAWFIKYVNSTIRFLDN